MSSAALQNVEVIEPPTLQPPIPLPPDLAPVESFDLALLPDALRPWVADISSRMQCPPDFAAVGAVASLAAVVGRKIGIRPQRRDDWLVVPNLWALIVGRPGVMKSPALTATQAPIERLSAAAADDHATAMKDYQLAVEVAALQKDAGRAAAKKALSNSSAADLADLLRVDEPEEPRARRYKTSDGSHQAIAELLRQNPNGLLLYRDELTGLLRALDREDNAEARAFFLESWNGDGSYTVDRIGRGLNLRVEALCLSLLGGTQPGKLASYVRAAASGGNGDDGLLQRFGLLVWPDVDTSWQNIDRYPEAAAKNAAWAVFQRLDGLDPSAIGAERDSDYNGEPEGVPYLRFTPEAYELWVEWRTPYEAEIRGDDMPDALASHLAKFRKLIPSLALLFHLADDGTGPVTEQALLRALAWAGYLRSHAERVYKCQSAGEAAAARAILAKIRSGKLEPEFSAREVTRPQWSGLTDRDEVRRALEMLVDYRWLIETRIDDTGGRPSIVYQLAPGAEGQL